MQIRVITLARTSPLVEEVQKMFPYADVAVQPAIDVRETPIELLAKARLVTRTAVHSLKNGRRWHYEIGTKGAVGLAHANLLALEENPEEPLLLLEDDCKFKDKERFRKEIDELVASAGRFDLASFGARYQGDSPPEEETWLPDGFFVVKDKFWFLHCVLYTPTGRKKAAARLREPLDMQIDSLYGDLASEGALRVVCQIKDHSVVQRQHVSSVQYRQGFLIKKETVLLVTTVVVLLVHSCWCTYKRLAQARDSSTRSGSEVS